MSALLPARLRPILGCLAGQVPTVLTFSLTALVAFACVYPGPAATPPVGVALDWTPGACLRAATDADHDGLDDGCEFALARAFAPAFVVDRRDCLWRGDAPGPRLAGGYLFAAQPAGAGVRLAFLPAYHRDCGWSGPVCRLRGPGCGAHAGDSELVLVDVAPTASGRWATTGVFLSAHCGGRSDGRCRWFRGRALRAFTWADGVVRAAPRVWVARGKHAHYPSRDLCDTGHWTYDTCDRNAAEVRFPVRTARQNIGSRRHPAPTPHGCVTGAQLPLGPAGADPGARECPWDAGRPFRGWQADGSGAAPAAYGHALARFAGF